LILVCFGGMVKVVRIVNGPVGKMKCKVSPVYLSLNKN